MQVPAPPTILVFGSTGAFGGAVIKALSPDHTAGRIRLVATARTDVAAAGLEQRGIECRRIDLDHAEHQGLEPLVKALDGIDRVFLLTGYDVKMLSQSKAVIDAAHRAGVSHITHLGAHASPTTTIVHLGWHQMIEAYLTGSGLSSTNLHPTSFMQNLLLLKSISGLPRACLRTTWVRLVPAGSMATTSPTLPP